jgi:hypothetical protein
MTRRIPCLVQLPGMWSPLEMFNRRALCPLGLGQCDEVSAGRLPDRADSGVRSAIGMCDAPSLRARSEARARCGQDTLAIRRAGPVSLDCSTPEGAATVLVVAAASRGVVLVRRADARVSASSASRPFQRSNVG